MDLDQLLDLSHDQLMELVHCRARRRFARGLKRKPVHLMRRLRKAKKEAAPMEKPDVVKTHLRNMIILPEMIGSMVGVYNGKTFNQVEIKVGVTFVFFSFYPVAIELRIVIANTSRCTGPVIRDSDCCLQRAAWAIAFNMRILRLRT